MTTASSMLERRMPSFAETIDEAEPVLVFEELGERASKELGYHTLKHEVQRAKTNPNKRKFLKFLQNNEIAPFDPASVEKYKEAMLEKTCLALDPDYGKALERRKKWLKPAGIGATILLGMTVLITIGGLVCSAFNILPLIKVYLGGSGLGCLIGLSALGVWIVLMDPTRKYHWQRTLVSRYDKAIPEFALQRMLQIRKDFPSANFFIDEITDEKPDPFLVVLHEEESYYIEVWGEPGFKQLPVS